VEVARRDEERRGEVRRRAGAAASVDAAGAAALRVGGFLRGVLFLTVLVARRVVVAARRVVDVARAAVPDVALRAIFCTCLLKPSNRLKTRSMSACFALRRT
jgi:hypothetical protein